MKGMQVRYRLNGHDWGEWTWLDDHMSWSYGQPFISTIRLEFRWWEIPVTHPTFTNGYGE